ncbi:PrsW family glutamic-type intramembrane protease [Actinomycetospora lemnae]|uniref:PrsW family glutamic-type intramembrane protease n=1 Tax=Actinomycetospora lemnae TaxID=3019891 RepID=A0ABT5SXR6_9PSEU|nr:PrsW family glutamic-type intramembrane protease [Actinomycetospora sp. DW7H6]MDD7966797.1 PrsW family glutamic-type intramembrane protease [Actinomycetospora sp. DW7H6]
MTSPAPRLPDLSVLFPFRAWLRHPALRAWTTWLFVALVATPPLALVLFDDSTHRGEATVFAAYFAAAWFLVLWVLVRPRNVHGALLAQVVGLALVIEMPLAIWLEQLLGGGTENLFQSVLAVGIPEELAKALPVVLLVFVHRHRVLVPRDTLFLGAVSGLAFGAAEAVKYAVEYMPSDLGRGGAMVLVWRFVAGPVVHAVWAGMAGYFVGLAAQYREPRSFLALAGLGIAFPALLHGLNNWDPVNGTVLWVLVDALSALLFVAYARVGLVASRPAAVTPLMSKTPDDRHGAAVDPPTAPIALSAPAGIHAGPRFWSST